MKFFHMHATQAKEKDEIWVAHNACMPFQNVGVDCKSLVFWLK